MQRVSRRRYIWFSAGRAGLRWWLVAALVIAVLAGSALLRGRKALAARGGELLPARARRHAGARERSVIPEALSADQQRMESLSHRLRELVHHAPARAAAVYVEDVASGRSAGANAGRPFLAASLIKVPVMATTYDLWRQHPERKTRVARTWMEQMITVSDNASTDRLIDLVGGPEVVTRFCEQHGWRTLQVRHAILNHRGRGGTNTCTAREMGKLLVSLDQRKLVTTAADEEMWRILLRQKKRHRIPAGLPNRPDVLVGNKTGTLGNALHDAGIIHTPAGRYALCILLSGQRSDASGERFCRAVSRVVYDAMGGERPPTPTTVAVNR